MLFLIETDNRSKKFVRLITQNWLMVINQAQHHSLLSWNVFLKKAIVSAAEKKKANTCCTMILICIQCKTKSICQNTPTNLNTYFWWWQWTIRNNRITICWSNQCCLKKNQIGYYSFSTWPKLIDFVLVSYIF